ncbi:MAG: hypothetical protein KDD45_04385 [Bdellovibrionales bacterium]|nr:hypothetical protein [Bdellovibrionales bacterium]
MNRFVCPTPSCKTEQCRSCQATPYHLGMNCKEYKERALSKYFCRDIENADIAMNLSPKRMLILEHQKLWPTSAGTKIAKIWLEELATKYWLAVILAMVIEDKKNVCLVLIKNVPRDIQN